MRVYRWYHCPHLAENYSLKLFYNLKAHETNEYAESAATAGKRTVQYLKYESPVGVH